MRSLRTLCLCAVMTSCLLSSGCDLTLGPKVKTQYVIVHPGKPLEILSTQTVVGRVLDGSNVEPVMQDVGGWIVMPREHWEAVERVLGQIKGLQNPVPTVPAPKTSAPIDGRIALE